MSRPLRWYHAVPLVMALPVLGGAGVCGVVLVDIAQRDLILEPVTTFSIEADHGSVEVATLDRNGITLFYYMVGSLYDIGDTGHQVDGDTLHVFSYCIHHDNHDYCNVSWTSEIMPGTAVDVVGGAGDVKLYRTDAPATVDLRKGALDGEELLTPSLEADVETGEVTLEYIAAPASLELTVGEGNVLITLPAAAYRCELVTDDGDVVTDGIMCDDTATNVVHVEVEAGDITLVPGEV
ncbi:MAG TPA: hypothetical protein VG755_08645 [Nannocystaceae bacterium]|nr:hypothetical protein [Nannocystaceae bacterium]